MLDALVPVLVFLLSTIAYVQVRYRRHRPDAPELIAMESGDVVRDVWRLKHPFVLPRDYVSTIAAPDMTKDAESVMVDATTSATVPWVAGAPPGEKMAREHRLSKGLRIAPTLAPTLCTSSHRLVRTGPGGVWGTWLCTADRTYVVLHEGACRLELIAPSAVRTVGEIRTSDGGSGLWLGDAVKPAVTVSLECGAPPHAIPAGWGLRLVGAGLTEVAFYGTLMSRLAILPEYMQAIVGGGDALDEQCDGEEFKAATPAKLG